MGRKGGTGRRMYGRRGVGGGTVYKIKKEMRGEEDEKRQSGRRRRRKKVTYIQNNNKKKRKKTRGGQDKERGEKEVARMKSE